MFDRAAMLACFRYLLGCLWPCLTKTRDSKDANTFIGNTSVGSASIWGIPTDNISSVCTELFSTRCLGYWLLMDIFSIK